MSTPHSATMRQWLTEPLPPEVSMALERLANTDDILHIAVMPDVHLAKDICIGTVIATEHTLYPDAIGGDIGCGITAMRFDCGAGLLDDQQRAAQLLAGLYKTIPTNKHNRDTMPQELPPSLARWTLSHPKLEKRKHRDGRVQFGTLGRGNHFLEFQSDEEGALWLMLHSGSRAMGQAIRGHHLEQARSSNTRLLGLDTRQKVGRDYLSDLQWALLYAQENRRAMLEATAGLLHRLFGVQAERDSLICSHHNHVAEEEHFGRCCWVHRKGAVHAAEGHLACIPGSMGSASFHVEGRGCAEALCSSSHGAGRSMSRHEARRRIPVRLLERELEGVWFDRRMAQKLCDEAPSAYKDIHAVMRAQKDLVRIVRSLQPVLCYKGG